jgi:hypothetical protein
VRILLPTSTLLLLLLTRALCSLHSALYSLLLRLRTTFTSLFIPLHYSKLLIPSLLCSSIQAEGEGAVASTSTHTTPKHTTHLVGFHALAVPPLHLPFLEVEYPKLLISVTRGGGSGGGGGHVAVIVTRGSQSQRKDLQHTPHTDKKENKIKAQDTRNTIESLD